MSIETLFEGQELTEEFKTNVEALIEARVAEGVTTATDELKEAHEKEITELKENQDTQITEAVAAEKEKMVKSVDDFMNYAISEWAKDNAIAIDSGIKVSIAENFLADLKGIFEAHNVEVPEGKDDLVESLETRVEELESRLDESTQKNIDLNKVIEEAAKQEVIEEAVAGLVDTQAERVRKIAENTLYKDKESFASVLKVVVEGVATTDGDKEEGTKIDEDKKDGVVDDGKTIEKGSLVEKTLALMGK